MARPVDARGLGEELAVDHDPAVGLNRNQDDRRRMTHDLDLMYKVADRVVFLYEGTVIFFGPTADLERAGQHNERGPESLDVMLRLLAGHDLSHLNQIAQYIEAIRRRQIA